MKVVFLLIFIFVSVNLISQVHWTRFENNPIMKPGPESWDLYWTGPMSVLYNNSIYHMWYDGGAEHPYPFTSGHATSLDGITWEKDTANPVITGGAPGEWDDQSFSDPYVIKVDSLFHMWYVGDDSIRNEFGGRNHKIGHATSADGISWTKDPDNPVPDLAAAFDPRDFMMHGVVIQHDGLFHMYFAAGTRPLGTMNIYHAESEDAYGWRVTPEEPILVKPKGEEYCYPMSVIYDGSQFLMWYHLGIYAKWRTHLAYSPDGIHWESYPHPVLIPEPTGSWDKSSITRSVVRYDSIAHQYKMWYSGGSHPLNGEEAIGYAVSDTCSDIIAPAVLCESSKFTSQDSIEVSSTEDGVAYLWDKRISYNGGMEKLWKESLDSVAVQAHVPAWLPVAGLRGYYSIYAVDGANNVSFPHEILLTYSGQPSNVANNALLISTVYPNPTKGLFQVLMSKPGSYTLEIHSMSGQLIYRTRFEGETHENDIRDIPGGIYSISIRGKDSVDMRKIIKQ